MLTLDNMFPWLNSPGFPRQEVLGESQKDLNTHLSNGTNHGCFGSVLLHFFMAFCSDPFLLGIIHLSIYGNAAWANVRTRAPILIPPPVLRFHPPSWASSTQWHLPRRKVLDQLHKCHMMGRLVKCRSGSHPQSPANTKTPIK